MRASGLAALACLLFVVVSSAAIASSFTEASCVAAFYQDKKAVLCAGALFMDAEGTKFSRELRPGATPLQRLSASGAGSASAETKCIPEDDPRYPEQVLCDDDLRYRFVNELRKLETEKDADTTYGALKIRVIGDAESSQREEWGLCSHGLFRDIGVRACPSATTMFMATAFSYRDPAAQYLSIGEVDARNVEVAQRRARSADHCNSEVAKIRGGLFEGSEAFQKRKDEAFEKCMACYFEGRCEWSRN